MQHVPRTYMMYPAGSHPMYQVATSTPNSHLDTGTQQPHGFLGTPAILHSKLIDTLIPRSRLDTGTL